jgi:hypothetical protein
VICDHGAKNIRSENISKEKFSSAEIKNEKIGNFFTLFVDR